MNPISWKRKEKKMVALFWVDDEPAESLLGPFGGSDLYTLDEQL